MKHPLIIQPLLAFETWVQKWVTLLSVLLFTCGVSLYTVQIILRIFFKSTLYWIDPMIGYLFTIAALWGAALACQHNENIKIELFKKWKQIKFAALVVEFFSLVITVFIIIVFYLHFNTVRDGAETTFSAEALKDIPYMLIFISSLVFYIARIIRILQYPASQLDADFEKLSSSS
ncbi:hypothetical protein COTS27_00318 [Spirochaetota bacterium]|nr:hypothetical protein COTS27_00318 [Spirochaetota bacterium]